MTDEVLELLKKVDGIFTGHFVYTSGKHAPRYLNKMALFAHPIYASEMGKLFTNKYKDQEIDVVVAPALGGIILAQWVAYHLSKQTKRDIIGIYTEKTSDNQQVFTRNYDAYVKGKKILIVEDIVTTGGSVKKVVEAVKQAEGQIIEVCSIANINTNPKSITDEIVGAKYSTLAELPVALYDATDCPLCKTGVPINTSVGHGKKYLEEKKK